jgi:hypothetical protein
MTEYRILKVTEDDYDKIKGAFGRTSHPEYAVCGFVDLEVAPPKDDYLAFVDWALEFIDKHDLHAPIRSVAEGPVVWLEDSEGKKVK